MMADAARVETGPYPGNLLHLLNTPNANVHLIQTIVECLEKQSGPTPTFQTFSRCLNYTMACGDTSILDKGGFFIGNFVLSTMLRFHECYSDDDAIECLSVIFNKKKIIPQVVGDCIPMLLRQLFGMDEFSFDCSQKAFIPSYDMEDLVIDEENEMEDVDESEDEQDDEETNYVENVIRGMEL
ncbi:hypothetical protein BdWA1_002083 [Babesia duncani]|uniref:Uncharacterized protein n=1 Tax=Babesia duncani TaxID=323732 RepID=A0AAD9PLC1_9APIC|nr:hypothetical protein BdWA1_002083 [Babesia duncani]